MNCPSDGTTLLMSERHGIEIDYCPECRGVWLDRGELDKILERVQAEMAAPPAAAPPATSPPPAEAPPVAPQQPYVPPTQQPYAQSGPGDRRYDDRDRGYGDRGYDGRDRNYGDRRYDDSRYGDPRYGSSRDGSRRRQKRPMDWLGDLFD